MITKNGKAGVRVRGDASMMLRTAGEALEIKPKSRIHIRLNSPLPTGLQT